MVALRGADSAMLGAASEEVYVTAAAPISTTKTPYQACDVTQPEENVNKSARAPQSLLCKHFCQTVNWWTAPSEKINRFYFTLFFFLFCFQTTTHNLLKHFIMLIMRNYFIKLSKSEVLGFLIRISHQTARVRRGSVTFVPFHVTSGVRQCRILSPFLFDAYINDLSLILNAYDTGQSSLTSIHLYRKQIGETSEVQNVSSSRSTAALQQCTNT